MCRENKKTHPNRLVRMSLCCERAVKRCVNAGKNGKKYTGKLLDKLEFVLLLFAYNNVCVISFNYIYN